MLTQTWVGQLLTTDVELYFVEIIHASLGSESNTGSISSTAQLVHPPQGNRIP